MNAVRVTAMTFLMMALAASSGGGEPEKPAHVRVTVVVIFATTENNVVDKKLVNLAKETEKRQPELVGFQLKNTLQKSIPVGGSHEFELCVGQTLTVTIDKPRDPGGRIGLTLTTSSGTAVSYTCVCDKFFPVLTEQKTKCGKTLIAAVGAKPCTGKGP